MTTQRQDPAEREPVGKDHAGDKPSGAAGAPERTLNETGQGQGQSAGRPQTQPQE